MATEQHNGNIGSVLRKPTDVKGLIDALQSELAKLYPDRTVTSARIRYNADSNYLRKFEAFLESSTNGSGVDCLNEETITAFTDYMKNNGIKDRYLSIHTSSVRKIINLLPSSMKQRDMLSTREHTSDHKWDDFTPETQRILKEFRYNGRKLTPESSHSHPVLSQLLLADTNRKNIVDMTATFLRGIDKTDLLALQKSDIDFEMSEARKDGEEDELVSTLDRMRPIFSYMVGKSLMKSHPLIDVPSRKTGINLDYVEEEGINKLADLSTVDFKDFISVRNRFYTFSLCYDFALRNREGSLLQDDVFAIETPRLIRIDLPAKIQKTQRDVGLYSYFPDVTLPLLKAYLELRKAKSPITNNLMISFDGKPLGRTGCRDCVKSESEKLGILTYKGKLPSPHKYRHSFGTLNSDTLGLELNIEAISEHLRHLSVDLTKRIYITSNPKLRREKHIRRMEDPKARNNPTTIPSVTTRHISTTSQPAPFINNDSWITEHEAIRRTTYLKINYRSLREYALQNNMAKQNGRDYLYSASFIENITTNYYTRDEAVDILRISQSGFYGWIKSDAVPYISIGKVSLFEHKIISQKKRAS